MNRDEAEKLAQSALIHWDLNRVPQSVAGAILNAHKKGKNEGFNEGIEACARWLEADWLVAEEKIEQMRKNLKRDLS